MKLPRKSKNVKSYKTVRTLFLDAADLVETGWTKSYFAVDSSGRVVEADSPRACRFCTVGALRAAAHRFGYSPAQLRRASIQRVDDDGVLVPARSGIMSFRTLVSWNDDLARSGKRAGATLRGMAARPVRELRKTAT